MLRSPGRGVRALPHPLSLSLSHRGEAETLPPQPWTVAAPTRSKAGLQSERSGGRQASLHPQDSRGFCTVSSEPLGETHQPPRDPRGECHTEGDPLREGGPVYLSNRSSALPEKKVVTSLQPLLPTPWTWKET